MLVHPHLQHDSFLFHSSFLGHKIPGESPDRVLTEIAREAMERRQGLQSSRYSSGVPVPYQLLFFQDEPWV